MSWPSKRIAPAVGASCNRISFEVVVLPQPDSPMTPSVSPGEIEKSTPSTALTHSIRRRGKTAVVTGKCLARPSISNSDVGMNILFGLFGGFCLGEPAARRPGAGEPRLARFLLGAARQGLGAARLEGAAGR